MPPSKKRRLVQSEMHENRKKSRPSQQMSEDGPTSEQNVPVNQSTANTKGAKFKSKCDTNHSERRDLCDMEQTNGNQSSNHCHRQKDRCVKNSTSSEFYESNDSAPEDGASTSGKAKTRIPVRQELTGKDRKRDKLPGSHPCTTNVRNPRRRTIGLGNESKRNEISTIGLDRIDWAREPMENQVVSRASNHSAQSMCRICYGCESGSAELGPLCRPCHCRGTIGRVHVRCLEKWLTESGKTRCELCGRRYAVRKAHRYGLVRAIVMWMLSENRKQLLLDVFGILLMSPLAVMAALLLGKTFSGMIAPDPQTTPWPLVSTFVAACLCLVCYYCWISSAASRQVLSWWVWYRTQYEIRLVYDNELY